MLLKNASGIVAGAAILLASSSAFASDLNGKGSTKDADFSNVRVANWTGVYVGAQIGFGHTVVSEEDGQGGISLDGLLGGVRVGGDVQRGALVFGVFGEYNWSDEALEAFSTTFAEQTHDWSANARLGFAHGSTLFYVAGGYGQYDYETFIGDATVDGWNGRIGIEHKLTNEITLGLEAMRVWLDVSSIEGGSDFEDVIDITDDRVLARLTYTINTKTIGF